MDFITKLASRVAKSNSLLCVGLDPVISKLPEQFKNHEKPLFAFNKSIVDKTHEYACAFKPNSAFYEGQGSNGVNQLKLTTEYIKETYPDIPVLLDAKRADIGNTNNGYVEYAYDYLGVDGITLHPYLGKEALEPFLERKDKGAIILCKTSNNGAGEFQDLIVRGKPLYLQVAQNVSKTWNANNNCLLVIGATYPEELKKVREVVEDSMWFLIPGIGVQGGDIEKTVINGQNNKEMGMIISASRSIIFADSPKEEAERVKNKINTYRKG